MQNITIIDYFLLLVYLFIFYIVVKKRSIKYIDNELRKYFFVAFLLHMLGVVAYSMLVQYYYGFGDSFTFFGGGKYLREQLLNNNSNFKYFYAPAKEVKNWYITERGNMGSAGYYGVDSNLFIMRISALLSFISFNSYLIISLFFGLFAFAGQWKLFLTFNEINNFKYQKILAWTVLYTPSIWFWGSGLMKDSVCMGALGFIIHILYKNFVKKNYAIKDMISLAVLVTVLAIIKSYILIALAVSLSTFIFYSFLKSIKNIIFKSVIVFLFIVGASTIAYVSNFASQMEILIEESKVQLDNFQHNYEAIQEMDESSQAGLQAFEVDASFTGILLNSPVAIVNCLFRPYIWESNKLIILFSALESLLVLLSTVYLFYKLRFIGVFRYIFNNQYILFSFLFSMILALIIGFTTFNFGTIARYKIILLPFYFFMLVSLYTKYKEKKLLQ